MLKFVAAEVGGVGATLQIRMADSLGPRYGLACARLDLVCRL
jgi:hypothetical protein